MNSERKSIWIDLDNSPHVPLFAPIIKHYRTRGVEVIVTARDHSQTIELLKLIGVDDFVVVGRHFGKGKFNKVRGLFVRAKQLVSLIKKLDKEISVAISHGSRSMVLAARWLRIPIVTMYDYEFTETRIFNIFSDKVLVPERIPDIVLHEIGLPIYKRVKYPGIKEELYIAKFQPTQNFRETVFAKHRVSDDKAFALLRPPATTANYHDSRGEILLNAILEKLLSSNETFTLIVPRTREQATEIREMITSKPNFTASYAILDEAVDGLDLIYAADLVISGGGTMNREAALLGVPVYSIFAGRQGALDKQMESEGLITFIRTSDDLSKIKLVRRQPSSAKALTDRVEKFVIREIDRYLT